MSMLLILTPNKKFFWSCGKILIGACHQILVVSCQFLWSSGSLIFCWSPPPLRRRSIGLAARLLWWSCLFLWSCSQILAVSCQHLWSSGFSFADTYQHKKSFWSSRKINFLWESCLFLWACSQSSSASCQLLWSSGNIIFCWYPTLTSSFGLAPTFLW